MRKLYPIARHAGPLLLFFLLKNALPAQTPCNAWSNFPWHDWIAGVNIGPATYPSGKSVYSNFAQTTLFSMKIGEQTPVQFTTGFSYEAFAESWAVWLDIDHDGIFHPTDELAFAAAQGKPADGTPLFSTTGFIKLPADALTGPTRMRVAMRRGGTGPGDPCDVLDYGEIEDYLINVLSAGPPTNCQIKVGLIEKSCLDTLPDSYRIGFQVTGSGADWVAKIDKTEFRGKVGSPFFPDQNCQISAGEWLLTVRDSANLACKSSEKVVPPDPCMPEPGGLPELNYCGSKASFPWHDWIAGVKIGGFEMASGKSAYSDFSENFAQNPPIELTAGQTSAIALTAGFSYATFPEFWKIWLDADRDGVFDEQTETVFHGIAPVPKAGTPTKILTGNLKVPAGALAGPTRLRVTMQRGAFAGPCGGIHYGEVEDYAVNVSPKSNIAQPGGGGFPNILSAKPKPGATVFLPNPASGLTAVFFEKKEAGPIRLRLLDGTGRLVFSKKTTVDEGPQSLEIPLEGLPTGLYFWQMEMDGAAETGKLSVF